MTVPRITTSRITIKLNIHDYDTLNDQKIYGFHLTRSKWDPYPWIECVQSRSIAEAAGLKAGDCLLQVDQIDVVGLKVSDIASLIKMQPGTPIELQIWRSKIENEEESNGVPENCNEGIALSGPLPVLIRKLLKALSGVVNILECPVCLETAISPISQCVHGHIICTRCRTKTMRCPICRVRLGQGRCLIADEVQRKIREVFDDKHTVSHNTVPSNLSLKRKLFGLGSFKALGENQSKDKSGNDNNGGIETLMINQMKKSKAALTRLFRGGCERAISEDNLTTKLENSDCKDDRETLKKTDFFRCSRLGELRHSDRNKSASTGELCKHKTEISSIDKNQMKYSSVRRFEQYLTIPQSPRWGGSLESVSSNSNDKLFLCPLLVKTHCGEPVTDDRLAAHLQRVHSYITQIHIYGKKTTLPMPIPFGTNAIYIFHYEDEIFIFQNENNAAWIVGTSAKTVHWILRALTEDNTELKLQKQVLQINNTVEDELQLQKVLLPNSLSVASIDIELVALESDTFL